MDREQKRKYIKHYIALKGVDIFRLSGIKGSNFYSTTYVSDEKLDKAIEVIDQHLKELEKIKEGN